VNGVGPERQARRHIGVHDEPRCVGRVLKCAAVSARRRHGGRGAAGARRPAIHLRRRAGAVHRGEPIDRPRQRWPRRSAVGDQQLNGNRLAGHDEAVARQWPRGGCRQPGESPRRTALPSVRAASRSRSARRLRGRAPPVPRAGAHRRAVPRPAGREPPGFRLARARARIGHVPGDGQSPCSERGRRIRAGKRRQARQLVSTPSNISVSWRFTPSGRTVSRRR
jgi:hypothetical protein